MIGGTINVDSITWGQRAMTLRGTVVWHSSGKQVFTIAYSHVSCFGLINADGDELLQVHTPNAVFAMRFQDAGNARDTAAELQRRMEAPC